MKNLKGFDQLNEAISKETLNRMEGLAHEKNLKQFNELLTSLTKEWLKEGFELSDISDYIDQKLDHIGFKNMR
jgi:hypothetical protein